MDRHHAGMLELCADLGFLDEALPGLGVISVAFAQDLDRQITAEPVVTHPVDDANAAAAQLLLKKQLAEVRRNFNGHRFLAVMGPGLAAFSGWRAGREPAQERFAGEECFEL